MLILIHMDSFCLVIVCNMCTLRMQCYVIQVMEHKCKYILMVIDKITIDNLEACS